MQKDAFTRMAGDPVFRARMLFWFRILQFIVLFWIMLGVALFLFYAARGSFP